LTPKRKDVIRRLNKVRVEELHNFDPYLMMIKLMVARRVLCSSGISTQRKFSTGYRPHDSIYNCIPKCSRHFAETV
jgi:hypothetical protein